MKLTELRDELATRAGESEQHAYDDLLPGVRRKVRSTKRNRIAGAAAGAAVVAIVAAGIVPGMTDSSQPDPATSSTPGPQTGPDGMPSREPVWDRARDLNKNGITLRHRIAGETLLAGTIGDKGQAEIRTTFVPRSAEVGLRYFCSSKARKNTRFEILIGGEVAVHGGDCSKSPMTDPLHESRSTDRTLLPGSDVGKPVEVVMRLIDSTTGQPVDDTSILLAAGIYDPGPQRTVGTVKIPELYQHQGFEYRLAGFERGRLAPGAKVGITTPADTPFLVAYGGYGGGAVAVDLVCGNNQGTTDWNGLGSGAYGWAMCPARPGGRTEVRWSGQGTPAQGEMFVAIYTQQR